MYAIICIRLCNFFENGIAVFSKVRDQQDRLTVATIGLYVNNLDKYNSIRDQFRLIPELSDGMNFER